MDQGQAPISPALPPCDLDTVPGDALLAHLDQMMDANRGLEAALGHAHAQLRTIYTLAEEVSGLHDPEVIQTLLFQHYASMLAADAIYVDQGGACRRIELGKAATGVAEFGPARVRAALADDVEAVRLLRRPLLVEAVGSLGGARAILGPMRQVDAEFGVLIALREPVQTAFDHADVLASEAALVYGGQILNNVAMVQHLQHSALETVCALVNAIDAKDNYTSDHSERVGVLARLTGERLGLRRDRLRILEWAGLLHDIGKIGITEQVLNKPGRLTDAEFEQMKQHSQIGYEMLKPVGRFAPVLDAVLYHHEAHNGGGYPRGLAGRQIPLDARIIHVVDIFDALTTCRPYRAGFDLPTALGLIRKESGTSTDPEVTEAFIEALESFRRDDPKGFGDRFDHLAQSPDEQD